MSDSTDRLTVDGTEVLIEGEGPETLLLIHGWPDTAALWDGTVRALRDRWRIARFTWPGYASNSAPDRASERGPDRAPKEPPRAMNLDSMIAHIAAIADAVSPDRPLGLVIHDWGAFYGYQYAMRHPQRVARIAGIDIGDAGSRELRASLTLRAKLMIVGYQGWLAIAHAIGGRLGDRMTRWMARRAGAPAPAERIGACMNYPYREVFNGGLHAARPVRIECPLLFVYGRRKPFMFHSQTWADRVAARPGCAVAGLDAGHWVMVGAKTEFERTLRAWLERSR